MNESTHDEKMRKYRRDVSDADELVQLRAQVAELAACLREMRHALAVAKRMMGTRSTGRWLLEIQRLGIRDGLDTRAHEALWKVKP